MSTKKKLLRTPKHSLIAHSNVYKKKDNPFYLGKGETFAVGDVSLSPFLTSL